MKYGITWTTLGEYLETRCRERASRRCGLVRGAGTVGVHGVERNDRPPTPEELDRMRKLVAQAMEEARSA